MSEQANNAAQAAQEEKFETIEETQTVTENKGSNMGQMLLAGLRALWQKEYVRMGVAAGGGAIIGFVTGRKTGKKTVKED